MSDNSMELIEPPYSPIKVLYIDIETAPALAYIWDLKTRYVPLSNIAEDGCVMCFAAHWEGSDEIEFWSTWDDGHEGMIRRAWQLLDEADVIVHFNGKRFDVPRLSTEFLTLRLGPPSPSHQVDLFEVVRKNFKVLSRSMNHILSILGLEEKMQHKGMALWTGCMKGSRKDQDNMANYNIQDVEIMPALYNELLPWITNHPNRGLWMEPGTEPICPNCGSTRLRFKSYKRTRVLAYKQYQCQNCGSYPRERRAHPAFKREDILV